MPPPVFWCINACLNNGDVYSDFLRHDVQFAGATKRCPCRNYKQLRNSKPFRTFVIPFELFYGYNKAGMCNLYLLILYSTNQFVLVFRENFNILTPIEVKHRRFETTLTFPSLVLCVILVSIFLNQFVYHFIMHSCTNQTIL